MMMDMLILLGLFIAILALAYFTYRNLVGLDSRLRKIENILQNAEVVTTTDPGAMPSAQSHMQPGEYSSAFVSPEYIAGWGGQGPVLTVQKEGDDDEKVVELVDEADDIEEPEEIDEVQSEQEELDNDEVDEADEIEKVGEMDKVDNKKDVMESVDDILTSMENDSRRRFGESGQSGTGNESVSRGPKVTDMKDALKKAGVVFPATAKKSDLQKLMEEHHIQV